MPDPAANVRLSPRRPSREIGRRVSAAYRSAEIRGAVCRNAWPEMLDPTPVTTIPGSGAQLLMLVTSINIRWTSI